MSLLERALTEQEEMELSRLAHSRVEEARLVERAGAVLAASRVSHMCDAVRATGKDKHFIRRWMLRYLEQGLPGLRDLPRSGAPCTFTREQRSLVVEMSLTSPQKLGLPFSSWTRLRLSDYLAEHHGFRISETHVGEILHKEGLRWKKQESWFTETLDPAFAEKRGRLSSYTRLRPRAHSSRV
jgi:transposase